MIESLAGVTIVTPDLDAAVAAYTDWLGYHAGPITPVGTARADLWRAPEAATARMIHLLPEKGEPRFIRLVEGQPAPTYRPLAHHGWSAAEIIVQDVDRLAERLGQPASPFRIFGPPAVLDFDFTDQIKAMQVVGPAGEVLYLTQVGAEIPGFDLPRAESFVGPLFIMVLGAERIAAGVGTYQALGRSAGPILEARVEVLSHVHGLPAGYRHQLTTVALNNQSFLEIDAMPAAATPRPLSSIGLPCGLAMVSFHAEDPACPARMTIGAAGEWLEIAPWSGHPF